MYDKLLIRIGAEDDLFQFTLPSPLFRAYVEIIVSIERGEIDTHTGDLARHDLHIRLVDWWTDKMPDVSTEDFDKALERTVEYALPKIRDGDKRCKT